MDKLLLQIYNLGDPIVGLYLFTGLWLAMLVTLIILHWIGKVSRQEFWRYIAALHIITLPLVIISLLATLGIIPAGILDSLIRWLDLLWP